MALNELSIFLKKNRQHRLSDQLSGRIAELSGAKSVNRQHCPDWTDHEIHYRVVFEHFPPLLLTLSQRVRGAVALGNEKGRQPDYSDTPIDALTPMPPASVSLKPGKKKANSVRPAHPAPTSTMHRALHKRAASRTTTT